MVHNLLGRTGYTTTRKYRELQLMACYNLAVYRYTTTRKYRELQQTKALANLLGSYTTTRKYRELQRKYLYTYCV